MHAAGLKHGQWTDFLEDWISGSEKHEPRGEGRLANRTSEPHCFLVLPQQSSQAEEIGDISVTDRQADVITVLPHCAKA